MCKCLYNDIVTSKCVIEYVSFQAHVTLHIAQGRLCHGEKTGALSLGRDPRNCKDQPAVWKLDFQVLLRWVLSYEDFIFTVNAAWSCYHRPVSL